MFMLWISLGILVGVVGKLLCRCKLRWLSNLMLSCIGALVGGLLWKVFFSDLSASGNTAVAALLPIVCSGLVAFLTCMAVPKPNRC